ncbi:MAG: carboxypeptidase regulatory-like domain-containing protein [Calditrichaeota bacterium]|nr:carboxypeptidase regulatory-like domain-containing protein [Calditrichota bacterium]
MNTHKTNFTSLLVIIFVLAFIVHNSIAELNSSAEGASTSNFIALNTDSPVQFDVTESNSAIELSVNFADAINLSNLQENHQLPVLVRWVRVPDQGKLNIEYSVRDTRHITGKAPTVNYESEGVYPPEPVVMSQPMIMRGVRIVKLTLYPVRWDSPNEEYLISQGFNVNISSTGGRGVNEVESLNRQSSQGFDRLIDALLVNPPRRDDPVNYLPGGYLLVANDDYPDVIDEFADWKFASGHPVQVLTFDPEITDDVQLKELIQEAYREFNFEYLVLFGNEDADPPLQIPFQDSWDGYYDVYFAQLEGDDPLADVTVGSFNCLDEENLICAVRRAISYQFEPYTEDLDWFTVAGVGVGMCSVQNDMSPSYTGKWVTEVLSRQGFDVTSSYYVDNEVDDPTPMVRDLYNNLCNFILIRAHQSSFDADDIEATGVYPFHFLVSSSTLSGAFNRAFRMGTPDDMRGPSAGFGHNGSPRTNVANALAGGFIESVFLHKIGSYGWARNYTIANLARVMPADDDDYIYGYYSSFRYYGDPGQDCWIGAPEEIQVEHNETIDPDATDIRIIVTDGDDEPVEGALVCLTQVEGIQLVTLTQEIGWAFFSWEQGDLNEEPLSFMVTGDNIYPYRGEVQVEDAEIFLSLSDFEIEDNEEGNGNGIPNAGETVDLYLTLENTGDEATGMLALTIHRFSPWVQVEGEVIVIDEFEPDQSRRINTPFTVHIANGCPDGESVQLRFGIGGIATSGLILDIESPSLEYVDIEFQNPLEPGSETEFSVYVGNKGRVETEELEGRLVSMSPFILVTNAIVAYGPIEVNGVVDNEDPYRVEADENTIPGSIAEFMLILEGDPGVVDTVYFSLPVGEPAEGDPLGPDKYGYIALDNGDEDTEWANAPEYNWLDINHYNGEIQGNLLELGSHDEFDLSVLVDLPFEFMYYGEAFEQITVCSNGWIAMGDQSELVNQQNWVMPGFDGAFGMIAVFWDRLYMNMRSDGVFSHYDQDNNRFCIMWETGIRNDDEWQANIFEVMLLDPEHHVTPTGDGQILMQYNTVNNNQDEWEANANCTVGISSLNGLDGLTYTYWGDYKVECAALQAERAILWTTVLYEWETGSISGNVTRYIDSTAVAGAMVRTSNGFETITGDDGSYELLDVTPGTFDITVTAEGYGGLTEEDVELEADAELEYDFVLPHAWMELDVDSLHFEIEGIGRDDPFTISSTGNLELEWYIVLDCPFIAIEPEEGIIESGDHIEIDLILDDTYEFETDHYEYDLIVYNTSPVNPVIVPLIVDILSVDALEPSTPTVFSLSEPYPNPFNSSTTIRFGLPRDSDVAIQIFDLAGRRIATLTEGRYTAGWHSSSVDASGLATGIYFVRMEAGDFRSIKRVLLIK